MIRKVGDAKHDLDSQIKAFSKISFTHPCRNSVSLAEIGYIFHVNVSGAPSLRSITWSSSRGGGNRRVAVSEKMLAKSEYCAGIDNSVTKSFFFLCAASAHCWATLVFPIAQWISSPSSILAFCAILLAVRIACEILTHLGSSSFVVLILTVPPFIDPSSQSIVGLNFKSHRNPNIARSSPRSMT